MNAAPDFWVLPRSFSIEALQARFDLEDTQFALLRQRANWQAIVDDTTMLAPVVRDAVHRRYGLVVVVFPDATDPKRDEYIRAYSDLPTDFPHSDVYSYDLATRADTIAIDFRGPDESVSAAYLSETHDASIVPINATFFDGDDALESEYKAAFLQYWDERMQLLDEQVDDMDDVADSPRLPLWDTQLAGFEAIKAGLQALVEWIRPQDFGLAGASSAGFGLASTHSENQSLVLCTITEVGRLEAFWNELDKRIEFTLRPDASETQVGLRELSAFSIWFDSIVSDAEPPMFEVKFDQRKDSSDPAEQPTFEGNLYLPDGIDDFQDWLGRYRMIATPPSDA